MTVTTRILAGAALVALLATPALAQKTTFDYHRGADFSALRTFSFRDTPPLDAQAAATTAYDSPIVRQNTNAAIAAQLEGRGMKRDDENPDVFITTHRTFKTEYIVYGSAAWGYGWGCAGCGPDQAESITIGTLTVDVTNARTGELLWRGIAERDAHPMSNPKHRLERINEDVTKMFRNYPAVSVATSGQDVPKPTGK